MQEYEYTQQETIQHIHKLHGKIDPFHEFKAANKRAQRQKMRCSSSFTNELISLSLWLSSCCVCAHCKNRTSWCYNKIFFDALSCSQMFSNYPTRWLLIKPSPRWHYTLRCGVIEYLLYDVMTSSGAVGDNARQAQAWECNHILLLAPSNGAAVKDSMPQWGSDGAGVDWARWENDT